MLCLFHGECLVYFRGRCAGEEVGGVDLACVFCEVGARALPVEIVDCVEDGDVYAEGGQSAEEDGVVPCGE